MLCLQIKLECNSLDRLLTCESNNQFHAKVVNFPLCCWMNKAVFQKGEAFAYKHSLILPLLYPVMIFTSIHYQPHVHLHYNLHVRYFAVWAPAITIIKIKCSCLQLFFIYMQVMPAQS